MYNTASHSCMCSAAVNYPIRLLSRQCNPFTTEILAYINGAPQKIIVLSDLDEHMAFPAGNAFYEKGVDNIFIVSGGTSSVWPMLTPSYHTATAHEKILKSHSMSVLY
jgi:hypothetical protein